MDHIAFVHVVDDNARIREGLRIALESAGLAVQVHNSALDFIENVDPAAPGCLVLDLKMPGMDGMDLLRKLHSNQSDMAVIVISGKADVATAVQSMKLGALDLLQKPFDTHVLVKLTEAALLESQSKFQRRAEIEAVKQKFMSLTERQRQLLGLIVSGLSNKQIALKLKLSNRTIANHRAHLMARVGAANAADLTRLYLLSGLLPSDASAVNSIAH